MWIVQSVSQVRSSRSYQSCFEIPDSAMNKSYVLACLSVSSQDQQGRSALIQLRPESPEELRERLRQMSDLELRRFGQRARKLSDPKMNFGATQPHAIELEEARAEWSRRHPPNKGKRINRLPDL